MTAQPLTEAEFRLALDGLSDYDQLSRKFVRRILSMSRHDFQVSDVVRDFCNDYDIPLDAREEEGR